MRKLWTQPLVTFSGKYHSVVECGLNPLPVQQPIPVWFGGEAEPVLRRITQFGDGWLLVGQAPPETEERWQRIQHYAGAAGRDPATIGLEGGIRYGSGDPVAWRRELERWRAMGAS